MNQALSKNVHLEKAAGVLAYLTEVRPTVNWNSGNNFFSGARHTYQAWDPGREDAAIVVQTNGGEVGVALVQTAGAAQIMFAHAWPRSSPEGQVVKDLINDAQHQLSEPDTVLAER